MPSQNETPTYTHTVLFSSSVYKECSFVLAIQEKMHYDHQYFRVLGLSESTKDLRKTYILTLICAVVLFSDVSLCGQIVEQSGDCNTNK